MPYNPKHEIFQDVLTAKQLHHNEGESALKNLNKICNMIGYRRDCYEYGSSFETFLKDNPGCVDAIQNWMAENFTDDQMQDLGWVPGSDDDEEDDDEEIKEEDISH
jgi:hypothetical protein